MNKQNIKNVIQELFRQNIHRYPEYYNSSLEQAKETAIETAKGYWDNRNESEIESDSLHEVTLQDYQDWCIEELESYIEKYNEDNDVKWFELFRTYIVRLTEDYSDNNGDPEGIEEFEFYSYKDAKVKYEEELKKPYYGHGLDCLVEIYETTENEEGEMINLDPLDSDWKKSGEIPEGSVILTYSHHRYMNYAYEIEDVRFSNSNEKYSDLHVCVDSLFSRWDCVYSSIIDLMQDFERPTGAPLNKINKGQRVILEFLKDNEMPGYCEETETEEEE
jgi:hypothetical protein